MNPSSIFIIVPAFNEQEVLRQTICELVEPGYSVVLVDDGSSTPQQQFVTYFPVHCVRHELNLGQGAALQTGTEYALEQGAEFIIHFDADGQHLVSDISKLLRPLLNNDCDVV
ncbi:MAG TPA: glycosyltransferase family 2 protein, partial [Lacibacter sp.]|nr:glycosyltransferase family 2 protein [Lacibacter sp.]